jgi:hypothetical protein
MSIETIGSGLKTRLDTITGLRVFAPNELPEALNEPPVAVILPGEVRYHSDFVANYECVFRVILLVTTQDSPTAFDSIIPYIETSGTYSVLAAIEADRTLSSTCDDVKVVRNLGITTTTWGGIGYLSTEFEVVAYA